MEKKMLLIGILFVVVAVLVAFAAAQPVFTLAQKTNSTAAVFLLSPNDTISVPILLNQSSLFVAEYNATQNVTFYFMNSSAYAAIRPLISANMSISAKAESLEGKGVLEVMPPLTEGVFPYRSGASSSASTYVSTNASFLYAGTYYAVFHNGMAGNSSLDLRYGAISLNSITPLGTGFAVESIVAFVVFIAGVILIIYSFFRKPKAAAGQAAAAKVVESKDKKAMQQEVDRLYSGIDKKKKKDSKK